MNWILPASSQHKSLLQHLLNSRGIKHVEDFLNPSLVQLHSPSLLKDTETATQVILRAIELKQKIFIHGDYDVDGVCATAILWDFLYRHLQADVTPFIPSRFSDGYGLTPSSLDQLMDQGAKLVITVDCGIRDGELIKEYQKKGLEFVITDHHHIVTEQGSFPNSVPVVHPSHPQGSYPFTQICGAMVAWKLVQALAHKANKQGEEDLVLEYLDLVTLATVCDVMPLLDENRVVVKSGLTALRQTKRPGLLALYQEAAIPAAEIDTYHIGFMIGPRLNAAGRLESALTALRLLVTQSRTQAETLAKQLHMLNAQRQDLTKNLISEAGLQVSSQLEGNLIFVYGENWPEGILGLIAGKLSNTYYRPALAGSLSEGKLVGSARSIESYHIADVLGTHSHLLERYGGHAQAAGFTVLESNIQVFKDSLQAHALSNISAQSLVPNLYIDAVVSLADVNWELLKEIEQLSPFGEANPLPLLMVSQVNIGEYKLMGKDQSHIKARVGELDLLHFGGLEEWQGLDLSQPIDLAGVLEVNVWNGRKSLQFNVKAVRQSVLN